MQDFLQIQQQDPEQTRVMMSSQIASSKGSQKVQRKADAAGDSEERQSQSKATGRWTREEHFRFLEALKLYGKEWKRV